MIKISAILALTLSFAFGDDLPNDAKRLQTQRDQASKKIDAKFVSQLEILKRKYMKLGDLKTANAIEDLIAKSKELQDVLLATTWKYSAGKSVSTFTFNKDGTLNAVGRINDKLKWKANNNKLEVFYGDANSCVFDFENLSSKVINGRTRIGNGHRTLVPIDK